MKRRGMSVWAGYEMMRKLLADAMVHARIEYWLVSVTKY